MKKLEHYEDFKYNKSDPETDTFPPEDGRNWFPIRFYEPFAIYTAYPNRRIHDSLNGFGQVSDCGKWFSWDSGYNPCVLEDEVFKRRPSNVKIPEYKEFTFPIIKQTFPDDMKMSDIMSVQPLTEDKKK